MWVRTCFQAFGTLLICRHAAFAGAYDDCILESMKGVTSSDAATAIRNACANKFLKLVELSDLSFLDGFANYDPPNLWVTINNKSDIRIQSVTIGVKEKRTGKWSYYNLLNAADLRAGTAAFEPRAVTRAKAIIIAEQPSEPTKFRQEYDWAIARAVAYDDSLTPAQASPCTNEELESRNGDCWVKLSSRDKFLFAVGFDRGWVGSWNDLERQQYKLSGKNELKFPRIHSDLIAYFDQLYADMANRSISWRDASDLARGEDESRSDSDLAPLKAMYREHREPRYSGYLRKFIPPNKAVVSRWPDSPFVSTLVREYGNPAETITLFGLSDDATTASLDKFMAALLNIKSCKTLVQETESYKFWTHLTDEDRQRAKDTIKFSFSMQLPVVLKYPGGFFDERGELSAEILLDRSETVCNEVAAPGVLPIRLGDVMLADLEGENSYGALDLKNGERFISLNRYLAANGLQKAVDDQKDHRSGFSFLYYPDFAPKPLPAAVKRVLEVGAP